MRVLTVGNMYPPHHYGGYELVWQSAVNHLRANGYEARVLTTDTRTGSPEPDSPFVDRDLRWHLRDAEFKRLGLKARTALARHNHRVLERHLAEFRPDVVTWWSMGGLTLTMMEAVLRHGLPAVAFVHDEWLDYGRRVDDWLRLFSGPRRALLAPVGELLAGIPTQVHFATAATYVFVSECTRHNALDLGLDLEKTNVAHSGIDPGFIDLAEPHDWGWRLLYVGRLDRRKGVHVAVEAMSLLPAEARLEIIGGWDRREHQHLRGLAADLGLTDQVHFSGQLGRDQLIEAYARADAIVFPVEWQEPWGLVPLEAMARGRPVVATGRGGSSEYLVDGENCLLFKAGDAPDLARRLRQLAGNPELRNGLTKRGVKTAERHTEPIFNRAVEAAVLEAASRG